MNVYEKTNARMIEALQEAIKAVEAGAVVGIVISRVNAIDQRHITGDVTGVAVTPEVVRFALDQLDEWVTMNKDTIPPTTSFKRLPTQ